MITGLQKVALEITSDATRTYLFQLYQANNGLGHQHDPRFITQHEMLIRGLGQAQLFDVQNVIAWIDDVGQPAQYGTNLLETIEAMPCCLPPYPYTYLEWEENDARVGTLVVCGDMSDPTEGKSAMMLSFEISTGLAYCVGSAHVRFTPDGTAIFDRDENGKPRGVIEGWSLATQQVVRRYPAMAPIIESSLTYAAIVPLFAFSLLHCTNVRAVEVDPRTQMTRQQLRHAERTKRDLILYKVLEVKPLGSYRRSQNETQGEGKTKRLHHVRGHFSEYGEEYGKGKLFGRISGRFFVPPHVRGNLQEGVVAKTYKLAKPTGKEDLSLYKGRA